MKYYKHLLCAVLLLCVLFSFSSVLLAQALIHGTVINGSSKQKLPGVSVELRRNSDPGKDGELIAVTTSDKRGKFHFEVPVEEKDSLLKARTVYQGFPYHVPAYDGGKRLDQSNITIDPSKVLLPVFETTTSLVPLVFIGHHLQVESQAGGLKCVERFIIKNPTQKTFLGLGKNHATVLLALPESATNVRLDSGISDAKLVKNPGGYSIAKPIPPSLKDGQTVIAVHYEMNWPSKLPWNRILDFSREVQYPTQFFFVQRSSETEAALKVTGSRITDKATEPLSGDHSVKLNINGEEQGRIINAIGSPTSNKMGLLPGDRLHIEISHPINPTFWIFLGFLLLLIILIPLSLLRRSGSPSSNKTKADKMGEPVQKPSVYGRTSQQYEASDEWLKAPAAVQLIEQIAALDNAYTAGEVEETEYRANRNACKRALMQFAPTKLEK